MVEEAKFGLLDKLVSFSFSHFNRVGFYLNEKFKSVGKKMELAHIRIHPAPYFSTAVFISLIVAFLLGLLALVLNLQINRLVDFPFFHLTFNFLGNPVTTYGFVALFRDNLALNILFLKLFFVFPLLTFIFFLLIPSLKLSLLTESLEAETPFIGSYVSVMATGGISPYLSIRTFARSRLLPTFSRVAERVKTLVDIFGRDPLTAIEETAKQVPSRDLKELLMGYVTSVRTGGDYIHFLFIKTETLFRDRIVKMRQIGERMGMLMEAYIALTILLSLGLYSIFIVNTALPESSVPFFSGGAFFFTSFILTPFLSIIFIYLIDMFSPKYPHPDWSVLKVAGLSFTATFIFFLLFFFLPTSNPVFYVIPFSKELNGAFEALILKMGFTSGGKIPVLLAAMIIIGCLPPAIYEVKISREERNAEENMAVFLRDLVEARKAGLSPEKCIVQLKGRDYGFFSRKLRTIANQLSWGVSLREIYRYFAAATRSWLAKMLMFLLVEAIDYGGGSVKTLETMAMYSEMIKSVEKEKEGQLKPLLAVVYIGALILVASVVMLLGFVNVSLKLAGTGLAYEEFLAKFVTPIVLNVALAGLVAGKISSGSISTGFKHTVFLVIASIIALWLTPLISSYLAVSTLPR